MSGILPLSIYPYRQVVLTRQDIEAPDPGIRVVALARKPSEELRPSLQKLVQGTLEFLLESSHEAAAPSAAEATTAAVATVHDAVPVPVATTKTDKLKRMTSRLHGMAEARRPGSAEGGAAAEFSQQNQGENAQPGEDEDAQEMSPVDGGVTVKQGVGEWEGVTWDEDDIAEASSLGTISASLGTVEVASKTEDVSQAGFTTPDPQDLLICLKGIAGIKEVRRTIIRESFLFA